MDKPSDSYGAFWQYLSQTQQDLMLEGNYLMNDIIRHSQYFFKDYSFLVFPYAKAYEGFLKKLFLDLGFIPHLDYISDHLRLGKLLSPHLIERLGDRSLFEKIRAKAGEELAQNIWEVWTVGRNQIFHYYPHNLKMITFPQAEELINKITQIMERAYKELKTDVRK